MRFAITTLVAICCGCAGTGHDPNGHYVLESYTQQGRYLTLDVKDSIVLLNRSSVFHNQRDTIFIDPDRHTLKSAVLNHLNIRQFHTVSDSVFLHYGPGPTGSKAVFIRAEANPARDAYANSMLDVYPSECDQQCEHQHVAEQQNMRHLLVGRPKPGVAKHIGLRDDSIVMEFHNITFLGFKELEPLLREMKKAGDHLCIHVDKNVPAEKSAELRNELSRLDREMKLHEGRWKDGQIVYVRI